MQIAAQNKTNTVHYTRITILLKTLLEQLLFSNGNSLHIPSTTNHDAIIRSCQRNEVRQ